MQKNYVLNAVVLTLALAGCTGGSGSSSGGGGNESDDQIPDPNEQKCSKERKEYVTQRLGANATVESLMQHITTDPTAEEFWKNLPKCR